MTTQNPNPEKPTVLERLQSGELKHIKDFPKPQTEDLAWPTQGLVPGNGDPVMGASARHQATTVMIEAAKDRYGEDGIVIADAFSFEGGVPKTVPDMIGLYVTAKAYEAANQPQQSVAVS